VILGLLCPPERSFGHSDQGMGVHEISVEQQRTLEFRNGLVTTVDSAVE
jgi:hypothetical protein